MAVRHPDQIPHWQKTAEGYDSPTESTFEELRHVYSLAEWIQRDTEKAAKILGKRNIRLREPKVRLEIWPAEVRHTHFQLRAIWKYCNERCWELAPYAFRQEKRPYTEFSWVVYSTKARFGDDTTRTIAEPPAPAPAVNAVKQIGWLDNRPPPNAPRGPRGGLHNPIPHPTSVPRPAPNATAAPPESRGYANRTPAQPVHTPTAHSSAANGLSRQQGKAPMRFGQASFGSASRPLPSEPPKAVNTRLLNTTPASVLNARHTSDVVHPSRKPLIDTTGTPNAVAQNQTLDRVQPDRGRPLQAPIHHLPTPKSGPSQAPTRMPIHSSVPRNSETPSHSGAGRARMYTPTPGPSTRIIRPSAKPPLDARPSYRGGSKTSEPTEGKKPVASRELGTPRLHLNDKNLPPAGVQPPVPPLSSRAAGKQPARSASSPVNTSSPSVSRAQTTVEVQRCKNCGRKHSGKCYPLCSTCNERHIGLCRGLVCSACDKRHLGNCEDGCSTCTSCGKLHTGICRDPCSMCGIPHSGTCRNFHNARARGLPLPKNAAKQDQAPKGAEQKGAITSKTAQRIVATSPSMPPTMAKTTSAETTVPEVTSCKHRRKDQECVSCNCGCGKCHRPGKKCRKQTTESRQKIGDKRKADDADEVDVADEASVKVEPSTSPSKPIPRPKKKRKKEAKVKIKVRDSTGSWYNPIALDE